MKPTGSRRTWAPYLGLMIALMLLSTYLPVHADVFELEDGRRIEGTVLRELGDLVSIRDKDGKVVTVEKSDIKYHKKKSTAYDDYTKKKAALADDDIAGRLELAQWCESKGLEKEAISLYREVVQSDLNNAVARKKLGHELIGGGWYPKGSPEAAARRQEIADELAKNNKPDEPETSPEEDTGSTEEDGDTSTGPTKRRVSPRRPLLKGAPRVEMKLDELLEKDPPKESLLDRRLTRFFESMKKPMKIVAAGKDVGDDGYVLEVKLRVFFKKTQKMYGKMALFNVYNGVGELTLKEKKSGNVVASIRKFTEPFSISLERPKEEALAFAYADTVQLLVSYLSKKPFLKERGAKKVRAP